MKNKNYSHKNAIYHKTDEEIKKEITAICEKSLHLASQINSSWSVLMERRCVEASLVSKAGNDEKEAKAVLDEYQAILKSSQHSKGIKFDAFVLMDFL